MQLQRFFLPVVVCFFIFPACSKSDAGTPAAVAIEGVWKGKSSVLSEPYNNYFSFRLKEGGLLEPLDENGIKIGSGTWAFYNGGAGITGKYTLAAGGAFAVIATFDSVNGKLNGTWGNDNKEYGGGYWYMNKLK